jgi:cystathionine gamma-lyase
MGAITAVLTCLRSGDHVVASSDLYGGTYRAFEKVFKKFGLTFDYVDLADTSKLKKTIGSETKLFWLESPTNPLMKVWDIKEVSKVAKEVNAKVAVDNTFASPALQRPLELGADIVIHSTTKYISGHSDVVGGAVIVSDADLHAQLKFVQNAVGAVPSPLDCYLVMRGLKTLHVRMREHCQNAMRLANYLQQNTKVKKVNYPGLPSDPNHDVAQKQMSDFGGMLSFELKGGYEGVRTFLKALKLAVVGESLGGVETLIEHPASMTHASVPQNVRSAMGISDTLIRVSVGIEDIEDLTEDFEQALKAVDL